MAKIYQRIIFKKNRYVNVYIFKKKYFEFLVVHSFRALRIQPPFHRDNKHLFLDKYQNT